MATLDEIAADVKAILARVKGELCENCGPFNAALADERELRSILAKKDALISQLTNEGVGHIAERDAALDRVKALEDAIRAVKAIDDRGWENPGPGFERAVHALYALLPEAKR